MTANDQANQVQVNQSFFRVLVIFALKIWRRYLYNVLVDVFTNHKSLQYVFSQNDLNLYYRILSEFLKDYHISVLYHSGKANVLADDLNRLLISSVSYVEDEKNELVFDVHRLAKLEVWQVDSVEGSIMVQNGFEFSLVAEMKEKQESDLIFLKLKELVQSQDLTFSPKGKMVFLAIRADYVL